MPGVEGAIDNRDQCRPLGVIFAFAKAGEPKAVRVFRRHRRDILELANLSGDVLLMSGKVSETGQVPDNP